MDGDNQPEEGKKKRKKKKRKSKKQTLEEAQAAAALETAAVPSTTPTEEEEELAKAKGVVQEQLPAMEEWSPAALGGVELHPLLLRNLQRQGFVRPTPIQRLTLPAAMAKVSRLLVVQGGRLAW